MIAQLIVLVEKECYFSQLKAEYNGALPKAFGVEADAVRLPWDTKQFGNDVGSFEEGNGHTKKMSGKSVSTQTPTGLEVTNARHVVLLSHFVLVL